MTNVNPDNQNFNNDYTEDYVDDYAGNHAKHYAEERPDRDAAGALPLRGVAMILMAVAVMLGLWALYAFTQDDDSSTTASDKSSSESASAGSSQAGGQSSANSNTQRGSDKSQSAQQGREGAPEGAQRPAGEPGANGGAAQPGPAPAPAPGPAAPAPEAPQKVSVLNNSLTPGLAADISEKIKGDGYELGEVGNFNEEILPQTTVFFPEGDAQAEEEARQLASRYNGIARANIPSLPREATDGRGLTVVLTEN